jgi:hypothetical protein
MGVRFAATRLFQLYASSLRRWLRRIWMIIFGFAVGLFSGMYIHLRSDIVTHCALVTFCTLALVRWWAKMEPPTELKT